MQWFSGNVYDFKIQARKENERTRSCNLRGFYVTWNVILCFLSGKLGNMSNPFIKLAWSLGNFWVYWSLFVPIRPNLKIKNKKNILQKSPTSSGAAAQAHDLGRHFFYFFLLGNQTYKILETEIWTCELIVELLAPRSWLNRMMSYISGTNWSNLHVY